MTMTPTAIKAIPPMVTQVRVKLFGAGRVFTNPRWQPSHEGAVKSNSLLHCGHCFFIAYRPSSDAMMTLKRMSNNGFAVPIPPGPGYQLGMVLIGCSG